MNDSGIDISDRGRGGAAQRRRRRGSRVHPDHSRPALSRQRRDRACGGEGRAHSRRSPGDHRHPARPRPGRVSPPRRCMAWPTTSPPKKLPAAIFPPSSSKADRPARRLPRPCFSPPRRSIGVFATGGIGGVHRGAETTFDISADLQELGIDAHRGRSRRREVHPGHTENARGARNTWRPGDRVTAAMSFRPSSPAPAAPGSSTASTASRISPG